MYRIMLRHTAPMVPVMLRHTVPMVLVMLRHTAPMVLVLLRESGVFQAFGINANHQYYHTLVPTALRFYTYTFG